MTDREKNLVNLHKQFLKLHYKIAEYELAEVEPPADLSKEFKDVESELRLISKAIE